MLLATEHLCNREHSFKHTCHNLFVELWAGREIRDPIVVVLHFKRGSSALGVAADNGGRLELGKGFFRECLSESLCNGFLELEYLPRSLTTKCEWLVVKIRIKIYFSAKLKRDFRCGENFEPLDLKLDGAILLIRLDILIWTLIHDTLDTNHVFAPNFFGRFHRWACREHNSLHRTRTVAKVEEHHLPLVAAHTHPPRDRYHLANMLLQLADKCPYHTIMLRRFRSEPRLLTSGLHQSPRAPSPSWLRSRLAQAPSPVRAR